MRVLKAKDKIREVLQPVVLSVVPTQLIFPYGNFMPFRPIAVAMRATDLNRTGQRLGEGRARLILTRAANANEPAEGFWPEVSGRYALEDQAPPDPRNSSRRVLVEVFFVVAVAVLVSLAAIFWGPLLS